MAIIYENQMLFDITTEDCKLDIKDFLKDENKPLQL